MYPPLSDFQVLSSSELNLFVQIATSGDSTVAAAIGKRYLLGIEGFKQDFQKAPDAKQDAKGSKAWQWHEMKMSIEIVGQSYRVSSLFCQAFSCSNSLMSLFHQAKQYLNLAAERHHPGALALLGYIYCLGSQPVEGL